MARSFNRKAYFQNKARREKFSKPVTPATAHRDGKTVTITRGTSEFPFFCRNGEALHCTEALAEQLEVGDTVLLDGHTLEVTGKGDKFKDVFLRRYVYVTGGLVQELEIHSCLECGFETTNPRLIDAGGMGCVRCNH